MSEDGSIHGDSDSEFEYEERSASEDAGEDMRGLEEDDDDHMVIEPPKVRKSAYTVMTYAVVAERQTECVADAAELLDVSREAAFALLRDNGWDLGRLQEAWFNNEEKVRRDSGISPSMEDEEPSASGGREGGAAPGASPTCAICIQQVPEVVEMACHHGFCGDCWRGYLQSQVDDGKACIQTRCPQHKCGRAVPEDFFRRFCQEDRIQKYQEWHIKSYVDDNPAVKWCPNPEGCVLAVEYGGVDPIEIRCNCLFMFCWACSEEAHWPAACQIVSAWNVKNSAESENISWIMANTKKCPKCHRAIEKSQGCNHMVCSKAGGCGHEFCWLCLGNWATHGSSTGGYYQCNIYDRNAKEGKHAEEDKSRQQAKHALDEYMFYFERYMDHDRSMKLTFREEALVEGKVKILHDDHGFEIIELQFLYDALKQVRECRRALKWSYVHGYYIDESGPEKNLFEHLQKNLEEKTDNLHEKLEKDFELFFISEESGGFGKAITKDKFMEFRMHVTNFTNVTQKFLTQILADLGSGESLTCQGQSPTASPGIGPAPAAAFPLGLQLPAARPSPSAWR